MSRPKPWWSDPTKVGGLIMLVITIVGMIVTSAVSDARQDEKVKRIDETVKEQGEQLEEQEKAFDAAYQEQKLLGQDVGFVKETVKEILDEVKRKR